MVAGKDHGEDNGMRAHTADPKPGPKAFGRFHCQDRLEGRAPFDLYRARTQGLAGFERVFAIKVLGAQAEGVRPDARLRLVANAALAGLVKDGHIASPVDAGQGADGEIYLVREFLFGAPLDLLATATGREAVAATLEVPAHLSALIAHAGAEAALALAAAHGAEKPLVHGAVSPSNIVVTTRGAVKMMDFGQRLAVTPERLPGGRRHLHTFAAPELLLAGDGSPAADVFALGSVLFQLATNKPPPSARNPRSATDVQRALAETSKPFAAAVQALLRTDAARRPNAQEAAELLRQATTELSDTELRRQLGALARRMSLPLGPDGKRDVGASESQMAAPVIATASLTPPPQAPAAVVAPARPRPASPAIPPPRPAQAAAKQPALGKTMALGGLDADLAKKVAEAKAAVRKPVPQVATKAEAAPPDESFAPPGREPATKEGPDLPERLRQAAGFPPRPVEQAFAKGQRESAAPMRETPGEISKLNNLSQIAELSPSELVEEGGDTDGGDIVPRRQTGEVAPARTPAAPDLKGLTNREVDAMFAPGLLPERTSRSAVPEEFTEVQTGQIEASEIVTASTKDASDDFMDDKPTNFFRRGARGADLAFDPFADTAVGKAAETEAGASATVPESHKVSASEAGVAPAPEPIAPSEISVPERTSNGGAEDTARAEAELHPGASAWDAEEIALVKSPKRKLVVAALTAAAVGALGIVAISGMRGRESATVVPPAIGEAAPKVASAPPAPAVDEEVPREEAPPELSKPAVGEADEAEPKPAAQVTAPAGEKPSVFTVKPVRSKPRSERDSNVAADDKPTADEPVAREKLPDAETSKVGAADDAATERAPVDDQGRLLFEVASVPPAATVWINGGERGFTPITTPLKERHRRVVIIKPGFKLFEHELDAVNVPPTQTFTLDPVTPPAKGDANLEVTCQQEGKYPISIDGVETGVLCPATLSLVAGTREVSVYVPWRFKSYPMTVELVSGQTVKAEFPK